MYKVGVLVASDKGSKGQRVDKSGELIIAMMKEAGYEAKEKIIIPDDQETISKELIRMSDELNLDLVLTTGGTGFSPRDWTPEATKAVIEREVPGIPEAMRAYSMTITPKAMLSRATAGIRANCLIINLPGSPKAVKENLECILPALKHGLDILVGTATDCAEPLKTKG